MTRLLDAAQTAACLPYPALVAQIRELLADVSVRVPERLVQALPGGGSLFVMPALDRNIAIAKLITFTPANAGTQRPAIQGDVVVFDIATGERKLILDGPTVTARRTAAVSLLAAQCLAPNKEGPLLIVGAGAQGRAHVEAFAHGLPLGCHAGPEEPAPDSDPGASRYSGHGSRVKPGMTDISVPCHAGLDPASIPCPQVFIASRSAASAQGLAAYARALGLQASVVDDADKAAAECPLIVTCTPANCVVLRAMPRDDAFIAAVGAFTPAMVELSPELCRHCASHGRIVVDTPEAIHEAGDMLQAGLDVSGFATLRDVVRGGVAAAGAGPVLFKSCGWAGWDLAAARTAMLSLPP
jgi:1-piperideine-2-carboxylate/1-pyrroline-2-carboxylate reductase [NAD(P)H]